MTGTSEYSGSANNQNQPMPFPGSQGRDGKSFQLPIYPKTTGNLYDRHQSMAITRR
jgi:hypothetical protein